jgi:hypothetical protein
MSNFIAFQNTLSVLQFETNKTWCLKNKRNVKWICLVTLKLYQSTWYLTLWSFWPITTSSYGNVERLNFFGWICKHKHQRCVVKIFNLFFMKVKLLNVLPSSIKPKTWTIIISTSLMNSLNYCDKMGDSLTFIHRL